MKVLVFGANGRTGMPVVRRARAAGHTVRAAVRDPEAFRRSVEEVGEDLEVAQADILDAEAVSQAVEGVDAVVSVVGLRKSSPKDSLRRGGENIVAAMKRHGVSRVISLTGAGVRFPGDEPKFMDKFIRFLLQKLQPDVLADSTAYVESITRTDFQWTIVRGPMLHDGPPGESYRVGYVGRGPGARASRETVARFIVEELDARKFIREAPMVSD
jgi:putative NADH-flavin reductase